MAAINNKQEGLNMKISECRLGMFVQWLYALQGDLGYGVGVIVGLTENDFKEAVFKIQWQDGSESLAHPNNLSKVD